MSKKNNVNPDHYKTAGRDTIDENAAARQNAAAPGGAKRRRKQGDAPPNFIPGAAPVGEANEEKEDHP